jgi:shikimate dehydrogenase
MPQALKLELMTPAPLSGATRLVPILAFPVDHVRAPRTYNPAFAAAGLDWFMVPMGVHPDDLATTLAQLARITNLQGVNLTLPHKAAARRLCRWLTAEAAATGMANTLRLEADGSWAGANSDGFGFMGAARAHGLFDPREPVAIVGSGGAGTAIAFALAAAGVQQIDVIDTVHGRAEALQRALQQRYPNRAFGTRTGALRQAGLAVNASPQGLHAGEAPPFDAALLRADAALFDIIAARDTELMAAAQARGLRVLGGRPMVEHQLAHQLAFWRHENFELAQGSTAVRGRPGRPRS